MAIWQFGKLRNTDQRQRLLGRTLKFSMLNSNYRRQMDCQICSSIVSA